MSRASRLPVTCTVGAAGQIVDRQIGPLSADRLEEMLAGLTGAAPAC